MIFIFVSVENQRLTGYRVFCMFAQQKAGGGREKGGGGGKGIGGNYAPSLRRLRHRSCPPWCTRHRSESHSPTTSMACRYHWPGGTHRAAASFPAARHTPNFTPVLSSPSKYHVHKSYINHCRGRRWQHVF